MGTRAGTEGIGVQKAIEHLITALSGDVLARPGETSEPDELFLQWTFEVDYTDIHFFLVISFLLWRHF